MSPSASLSFLSSIASFQPLNLRTHFSKASTENLLSAEKLTHSILADEEINDVVEQTYALKHPLSKCFPVLATIGFAGAAFSILLIASPVLVALYSFSSFGPTTLAAVLRGVSALQIGLLAQQLVHRDTPVLVGNLSTVQSTIPHWKGMEHASNDWQEMSLLLAKHIQYFSYLNTKLLFGSDSESLAKSLEKPDGGLTLTSDEIVDSLVVKRTRGRWKQLDELSLKKSGCFLAEEEECKPDRIGGINPSFVGLDSIMDAVVVNAQKLSIEQNDTVLKPTLISFGVIHKLLRLDGLTGLQNYLSLIVECSIGEIETKKHVMIAQYVCGIVLLVISVLSVMNPLDSEVDDTIRTSKEIVALLCKSGENSEQNIHKNDETHTANTTDLEGSIS